jgi:aquaporin Z
MSESTPATPQRLGAEFLGTFVLVFGGCGSAVLAANFPGAGAPGNPLGIGFLGVALAFGLTVLVMAYAVGHISGGHFNPAVTIGAAAARRFAWRDTVGYVVTQVVAAIAAAAVLFAIASGRDGFSASKSGFATNGYGDHSPGHYKLFACLLIEIVLTAVFLYVILGVTDTRAPKGFAPLAIGLSLTLIHLASIPVTNTSVNPARSIGPALFAGSDAISQLWLFLLAPTVGALIAGYTYRLILGEGPAASFEQAAEG